MLGTGAGGLDARKSFDVMKSEFENDDGILLCVYVLAPNIYNELIAENVKVGGNIKNPRVFISYTGEDIKEKLVNRCV